MKLLDAMQPDVDAETGVILGKLSDQDCQELSRLCALILESEQPTESFPGITCPDAVAVVTANARLQELNP